MSDYDLKTISLEFPFEGDFISSGPCGSGHINDTFLIKCSGGDYILQRINHYVFKDPVKVMQNVCRVTEHLCQKFEEMGADDRGRRALRVIRPRSGDVVSIDTDGNYWRAYDYVPNTISYDKANSPDLALEAGRAFGIFQRLLADLPGERLHETILDFHHTPSRFATFMKVAEADTQNRAAAAKAEIDFALSLESETGKLIELHKKGEIPERVTHNDTKLNNVLFCDQNFKNLCVVDLDTVMPGLALYDFGDMVRTTTSLSDEDERDLSKVKVEMPLFEAVVRGFLEETGSALTPAEIENLVFAGKLITFEIGLRFLTDHLEGDVYFKTHRPDHNLDRARSQFALVKSIASQSDSMQSLVRQIQANLS